MPSSLRISNEVHLTQSRYVASNPWSATLASLLRLLATLIRLYEFLRNSRLIDPRRSTTKRLPTCRSRFVLEWIKWWRMTGSNRRPPACKAGALPAELIPQGCFSSLGSAEFLVGLVGLEPTTPALSRRCSNQLSYRPSCQFAPAVFFRCLSNNR